MKKTILMKFRGTIEILSTRNFLRRKFAAVYGKLQLPVPPTLAYEAIVGASLNDQMFALPHGGRVLRTQKKFR